MCWGLTVRQPLWVSYKANNQTRTLSKQALLRGESMRKKSGKSISREKRVRTIVSEFETRTDNGHTCMDYMLEGRAHNASYYSCQTNVCPVIPTHVLVPIIAR